MYGWARTSCSPPNQNFPNETLVGYGREGCRRSFLGCGWSFWVVGESETEISCDVYVVVYVYIFMNVAVM